MSHLCNRCVRELLILARTWFAFGLPSKPGVTVCRSDRFRAFLSATRRRGPVLIVQRRLRHGSEEPRIPN
jgi:hypothetical protein